LIKREPLQEAPFLKPVIALKIISQGKMRSIMADGLFYSYREQGVMALVDADPSYLYISRTVIYNVSK